MQKIKFKDEKTGKVTMKTEYFEPKKGTPTQQALQLEYTNLLACCMGNADNNEKDKHCDSYKLGQTLKYIPNPKLGKRKDFRRLFKYKVIRGDEYVVVSSIDNDVNIDQEIEKILNLNEESLKSKRFHIWEGIMRVILNKDKKTLNVERARQIFESYQPDSDKKEYNAFCDFICYWLEKRFRKEFESL